MDNYYTKVAEALRAYADLVESGRAAVPLYSIINEQVSIRLEVRDAPDNIH